MSNNTASSNLSNSSHQVSQVALKLKENSSKGSSEDKLLKRSESLSLRSIEKRFNNGEDVSDPFKKLTIDEQSQFIENMTSNGSNTKRLESLIKHFMNGPMGSEKLSKLVSDSKGQGAQKLVQALTDMAKDPNLTLTQKNKLNSVFEKVLVENKNFKEVTLPLIDKLFNDDRSKLKELFCNPDGTESALAKKMNAYSPAFKNLLSPTKKLADIEDKADNSPKLLFGANKGKGLSDSPSPSPAPSISSYLYSAAVFAFAKMTSYQDKGNNDLQDSVRKLGDTLNSSLKSVETQIKSAQTSLENMQATFDTDTQNTIQAMQKASNVSEGFFGSITQITDGMFGIGQLVRLAQAASEGFDKNGAGMKALSSGDFWKKQGIGLGIAVACVLTFGYLAPALIGGGEGVTAAGEAGAGAGAGAGAETAATEAAATEGDAAEKEFVQNVADTTKVGSTATASAAGANASASTGAGASAGAGASTGTGASTGASSGAGTGGASASASTGTGGANASAGAGGTPAADPGAAAASGNGAAGAQVDAELDAEQYTDDALANNEISAGSGVDEASTEGPNDSDANDSDDDSADGNGNGRGDGSNVKSTQSKGTKGESTRGGEAQDSGNGSDAQSQANAQDQEASEDNNNISKAMKKIWNSKPVKFYTGRGYGGLKLAFFSGLVTRGISGVLGLNAGLDTTAQQTVAKDEAITTDDQCKEKNESLKISELQIKQSSDIQKQQTFADKQKMLASQEAGADQNMFSQMATLVQDIGSIYRVATG